MLQALRLSNQFAQRQEARFGGLFNYGYGIRIDIKNCAKYLLKEGTLF
jgi:hypothetical protein